MEPIYLNILLNQPTLCFDKHMHPYISFQLSGMVHRPAKSHGISVSFQKWSMISRSHGNVTKSHGIEGILLVNYFSARNANFCRI